MTCLFRTKVNTDFMLAGQPGGRDFKSTAVDLSVPNRQGCSSLMLSVHRGGPECAEWAGLQFPRAVLRKAIAAGFKDFAHMREDSDIEPIRDDPEFKKLIEECKVDESGSAEGAAK